MTETTAANPELLADQVSQLLVQPLEAASVVLSSGPRIFDTAGVLRIPKLTGSSAIGFVGEGGDIPDTHDTTFDELVLMPTSRKSLKVIERYTNELVRQSVIGIDAVLQNRLVKVVSDALDTALLTGDGRRAFRRTIKWRTGSEGRISYLKRGYGWDRTRIDGLAGTRIWTGHGILAHNLVKIS